MLFLLLLSLHCCWANKWRGVTGHLAAEVLSSFIACLLTAWKCTGSRLVLTGFVQLPPYLPVSTGQHSPHCPLSHELHHLTAAPWFLYTTPSPGLPLPHDLLTKPLFPTTPSPEYSSGPLFPFISPHPPLMSPVQPCPVHFWSGCCRMPKRARFSHFDQGRTQAPASPALRGAPQLQGAPSA